MTSKSKFYALKRNAATGFIGFMPVEGYLCVIGNMRCGVYQTYITLHGERRKIWYLIELESGLSFASGESRKKAVENAAQKFKALHYTLIVNRLQDSIEKYGKSPMYQEGFDLNA